MTTTVAPAPFFDTTNHFEVKDILDQHQQQQGLLKKKMMKIKTTTMARRAKKLNDNDVTKKGDVLQDAKKKKKNKKTRNKLIQLPSDISSVAFTDDLETPPSIPKTFSSASSERTPPPLPIRSTRQEPGTNDETNESSVRCAKTTSETLRENATGFVWMKPQTLSSKQTKEEKTTNASALATQVDDGKRKMKKVLTGVSKKATHAGKKATNVAKQVGGASRFQLKMNKSGRGSTHRMRSLSNSLDKDKATQVDDGKRKMKKVLTGVSKKATNVAMQVGGGSRFQLKMNKSGRGSTHRMRSLSDSSGSAPIAPPRDRGSKRHQRNQSANPMFDAVHVKKENTERLAAPTSFVLRRTERAWKLRDTLERLSAKRASFTRTKGEGSLRRLDEKAKAKKQRNAATEAMFRRRAETITIDDIVSGRFETVPAGALRHGVKHGHTHSETAPARARKHGVKYGRTHSGRNRAETITLDAIMSGRVETIPAGTLGRKSKSGADNNGRKVYALLQTRKFKGTHVNPK